MKHLKSFNEKKGDESQEQTSDAINNIEMYEVEDDKPEKINSDDYEIEEVVDVFTDPEEAKKRFGNEFIEEAKGGGAVGLHADLSVRQVKRGEIIWITALLRKKGSTSFNAPAVQGVLKVRVVDIYYGLQYLNKVINK